VIDPSVQKSRVQRRFLLLMVGLLVGAAVEIKRNWKVAENPPCVTFLDGKELAALAGAPLGEPEVNASVASCVADWGAVRVHFRRVPPDERDAFDRRAESWRAEPGFVSLKQLDDLRARLGVIELARFGGHARQVRLVVERPLGWLEVAVVHHWPDSQPAPNTVSDVEAQLIGAVPHHLPSSTAFFVGE
jgi:hypothetical protein